MEYHILSHLLINGEKTVGEIAKQLKISKTHASQLTSKLREKNLVTKKRGGKNVYVRPNMASPLIQRLATLVVIAGNYPPYTPNDFLTPESKRKMIKLLDSGEKTIKEIKERLGYSRVTAHKTLDFLTKSGVVSTKKSRPKRYRLTETPLSKALVSVLEYVESGITLNEEINRIVSDEHTEAVVVYGSEIAGRRDMLSDVDVLVVVNSPEEREAMEKYRREGLELTVFSRKGLVHLIRNEPWYLKLALEGRLLKGENLLKDLKEIPSKGNVKEILRETEEMLQKVGELPPEDKARILMYCIRTITALRLHLEEQLSQKTFYETLNREYPVYKSLRRVRYRKEKADNKKLGELEKKLFSDLKDVKEKEDKRSDAA